MTMLSFRVDQAEASAAQEWAKRLGVDRSEFLREALRHHLNRVSGEHDARIWQATPLDEGERSFEQVNDSGPAEDWSDWAEVSDEAR